jgi:DegV family protein with EDD domain
VTGAVDPGKTGEAGVTRPAGIALVTDSTCDLPEADKLRYGTTAVPLHVSLGETSYLDRVDLDSAGFYRLFREAGQVARSSQPSVGEFEQVYRSLLEEREAVISVHISARLSGTVQSAISAARRVDPERVRVVDARQVSVGLGLVVQAAGEAILAGGSLDEVVAATEAAALDTRVYSALPALDVAVRGGRLSARTARLAGMIQLKPLIVFDEEGGVHTDGARLGYSRALRAVASRVAHFAGDEPARVSIVHADGPASANYARQRLQGLLGGLEIPILEAGAVITTHVGLGTVAIGVQRVKRPPFVQAASATGVS